MLSFPECWSDDRRMKVLFAPLRTANRENYEGQIRFWKALINNFARENPRINADQLGNAFERKGEKPHCLREVLAVMEAAGEIKTMEQFQDPATGWISWSMQMIVRKPLQMIRDRIFANSSQGQDPDRTSYVVLEAVNIQADELLQSLRNQIISLHRIKERISEWGISKEALPLVLHELHCRQRVVTALVEGEDDPDSTVLKFGTATHKAFAFTEMELAIHKLESTERHLEKQIKLLEQEMHDHEETAKQLLGEKKRALAKVALRKRDSRGKRLEKRLQCLANVQTLIDKIHEVADDGKVIDAYRTGTKSLQMALKKSGITLDTVDKAIADMQDVMEVHDEIKSALATVGVPADDNDSELEKELEQLLDNDLVKQLEELTVISDSPTAAPSLSPEVQVSGSSKRDNSKQLEDAA